MSNNSGVVVTRTISKPEQTSSGTWDSEYFEGIYYYPRIPHVDFSMFGRTIWFFEVVLLTFALLTGVIFIIFMRASMNKYSCPRCKKPYFLKNEIPERCTRCGALLSLPKINLPE